MKSCLDCPTTVWGRALRCAPCRDRRIVTQSRARMRQMRAGAWRRTDLQPAAIDTLIARRLKDLREARR